VNKQIVIPETIITIDDFFSPEECDYCILKSESLGYDDAPITTSRGAVMNSQVRNNTRVMIDAPVMAGDLWPRLAPHVPSPLDNREAIGLNERFRFYRYDPGQAFTPHYDGAFRRENGEVSQITFMVYLNDDFTGGQTRFDLRYPYHEIDIVPKAGMALLFLHELRHEGAPVLRGRKYVLRSDVMYGIPAGVS
jgi:predicted 2-oxoglutarate/Fe(II)-dependent dioxygenase YbiX